jgi:hypothetical protein
VEQDAVPAKMAEEVCRLVQDEEARRRMRDGYRRVRDALGSPGVTRAIARDILDIVAPSGLRRAPFRLEDRAGERRQDEVQ